MSQIYQPIVRLRVLPALLPANGINADLRVSPDGLFLQKQVGLGEWENLIAIAELKGPVGPGTEFRSNGSYVQTRPEGSDDNAWRDLFALSDIPGNGGSGAGGGTGGPISVGDVNGLQTALDATEKKANRGAINGYAPTGADARVPEANLPVGTASAAGIVRLANDLSTNSPSLALTAAQGRALSLGKADKGTTLAAYGIGDAYTKAQTNAQIDAAVASGGGGGDQSDTPAQILDKLLTVDGPASGLDADTVDGLEAAAFVQEATRNQPNGFVGLNSAGGIPGSLQGFRPDPIVAPDVFVPLMQRLGQEAVLTDGYVEGSNLTDFSDLISANLERAIRLGRPFVVPQGLFLAKRQFVLNDTGIMIQGMGKTLSALQWTADATSMGIRVIASDRTAKPDFMHFRDFALYTEKEALGEAIFGSFEKQVRPNNGNPVTLNRYSTRFRVQDVTIQGAQGSAPGAKSSMGWLKGITCTHQIDAILRDVQFEGAINGTEPNYTSEYAFYIGAADGYGHPTGPFVDTCNVFHAKRAVIFEGNEGGVVTNSQLVGVIVGVDFVDNAGRPLLMCTNNHINAFGACIRADAASQIQIIGNSLYHTIGADRDGVGVSISSSKATSQHAIITNNVFESAIASTKIFTGITIFGCDHGVIDGNTFRPGRVSPDPSNLRGIVLGANARFFKVGDLNVFENPLSGRPEVLVEVNDGGVENVVPGYGAKYRKSADQAIAAGTETTITFQVPFEQIGNSGQVNTNPWQAPTNGTYEIELRVQFKAGAQAGARVVSLRRTSVSSGDIIGFAAGDVSNSSTGANLTARAVVRLRKGEFIYPRATSGYAATIGSGDGRTQFSWRRVGD